MNIYPIQPHPPKNPHTKTKDPRKNTAKETNPAEAGICPQDFFFVLIHAVSKPRQEPATEKPRLTVDTYSYTPHRYYTFPDTPNK